MLLLIVVTIGHFSWITEHYYGWLFVTLCLSAAIAVVPVASLIRSTNVHRLVAIFVLLGFLIQPAVLIWRRAFSPELSSFNNGRLETARWINASLPLDARIGAWNAGVLGYFTDRTIVNLDGLANDRHYFELLKSGSLIENYLRSENIQYLTDVDFHDMSMRFRQQWDHSQWFRGIVRWQDWQVIHKESAEVPIYVLRKKD